MGCSFSPLRQLLDNLLGEEEKYQLNKYMKKNNYGKIHDYAQCRNCDWDFSAIDGNKRKNIYSAIKKHIERTTHTITRETGSSMDYLPNK